MITFNVFAIHRYTDTGDQFVYWKLKIKKVKITWLLINYYKKYKLILLFEMRLGTISLNKKLILLFKMRLGADGLCWGMGG